MSELPTRYLLEVRLKAYLNALLSWDSFETISYSDGVIEQTEEARQYRSDLIAKIEATKRELEMPTLEEIVGQYE